MLSQADWGSSRLRQNIVPPSPQSASGPLFKNNQRIKHAVFQQRLSYFIDKKYVNYNATKITFTP